MQEPLNQLWNRLSPRERRRRFQLQNTLTVYKPWEELNDGAKYLLEKLYRLEGANQ